MRSATGIWRLALRELRRHLAGLISVVALVLDGGGDLRRALGEQLAGPLGHAGDSPVAEPSRRPSSGSMA